MGVPWLLACLFVRSVGRSFVRSLLIHHTLIPYRQATACRLQIMIIKHSFGSFIAIATAVAVVGGGVGTSLGREILILQPTRTHTVTSLCVCVCASLSLSLSLCISTPHLHVHCTRSSISLLLCPLRRGKNKNGTADAHTTSAMQCNTMQCHPFHFPSPCSYSKPRQQHLSNNNTSVGIRTPTLLFQPCASFFRKCMAKRPYTAALN